MSSENKFSLLASLTALPTDQNQQHDDDENILPPLAVEEVSGGRQPQTESSSAKNKVGGLLGSSGLLTSLGSTATVGGGLFDQLEEEERKAQEAEKIRRIEEEERERKRKIEKERQKEEAALHMKRQQEEAERAAVAAAAQAAAAAAVQESLVLPRNGSGSVMGGLQELSLNEDSAVSLGYRPDMNAYSNVMQGGVSNGGSNQSNVTHPQQNQYTMHNPPQQPPPPVPQEQQHIAMSMQQPVQPVQQQQQIQQAGYGASSYYYSTTGNVQQIHQQLPTTPVTTQSSAVYSSPMGAPNDNGLASSSYAQRSQVLQSHNSAPVPPNNVMSPYSQPNAQMQPQNPQQQFQQQQQQQQFPNMHQSNANNVNHLNSTLSKPKIKPPPYNPDAFEPVFGPITVTDPILVQSPGVFSGPPHWIYNVVVRDLKKIDGQDQFSAVVSNVRRRFRHFVALEDRLRADCLGAILPPRPDKHPTRAIDEASTRQSTQFALQRAKELETYLNALRLHPLAGKAQNLQLFLTLPDHIGAAWPEVSSSIFTRLTEVGTSTAVKISEGTTAVMSELNNESQIMAGEDNSELLALASAEGLRIGSVLQGVPKIEGAVAIMGELGERMSVVGLEVQKLVNNLMSHERDFATPFEILSSGLLKSGRRTSRLAIELGAATQVFTLQYKLCRYERLAFADRRSALVRRRDARLAADKKAQKLVVHQHSMQSMGHHGYAGATERDAVMSDEVAVDTFNEAEKIGQILQCEVGRISDMRKKDWSMSLKVIAANMKEAHAERTAIWESCRDTFLAENNSPDNGHFHPEYPVENINEVADSSSEIMN